MYGLLILCVTFAYGVCKTAGPVGNIIINTFDKCQGETDSDDFQLEIELKTDKEDVKHVVAKLNNKIPIDDTITYKSNFEIWETSGWKPKFKHDGKFCEDVSKFGPRMWEKLQELVGGNFPAECPVEPGSYSVENFQAISTDFNVPTIFYGKLKGELRFYKDDVLLSCVSFDGNSQAPS
ncbi:hypothetical protein FQR65_LT07230 [Abscondita terminalis]|nr:hypothetical protein FQR65_LT07230 [Abscondita terminalis]